MRRDRRSLTVNRVVRWIQILSPSTTTPTHRHRRDRCLAAKAVFAGNLTLPANAALTRRRWLQWTQPPTQSPSPPTGPATIGSTDPSPRRQRRNRYSYDKSGGRRYRGVLTQTTTLGGSGSVTEGGDRRLYRRGRVLDYSRGSGGVKEGGERRRDRRRRDLRSKPQA